MADESKVYLQRAEAAEAQIKALHEEIEELRKCQSNGNKLSPEVEKMEAENTKLAYQVNHLKRRIESEKLKAPSHSLSVHSSLTDVFAMAINRAFPSLPHPPVVVQLSAGDKFGDYQCNSAMAISQILKANGGKQAPRDIAQLIINHLPKVHYFDKVEVAGAGFINIYLNKEYISKSVSNILTHGVQPPPINRLDRVIVDFSAPNIAKEMHVGHLRSTIIGESICRLLEWLGHDVLRLNHIGDWGTQFGMLIAHLQERFPNYLTEMPPIADLQAFYKESKERFDNEPEFKKRAYQSVTQLQSKESSHIQAWQMICKVSRAEFEKLYERLGVTLIERGESFYQDRMEAVVKYLTDKELLEDDDGRKIMFIEGHKVPLIVVKSDGGFTYDTSDLTAIKQRVHEEKGTRLIYVVGSGQTSDLTAIKQRVHEEKGTRLIYVVGSGQSLHLETVFSAAQTLGWVDPKRVRVEHAGFGDVLGDNKLHVQSGPDKDGGVYKQMSIPSPRQQQPLTTSRDPTATSSRDSQSRPGLSQKLKKANIKPAPRPVNSALGYFRNHSVKPLVQI